MFITFVISFNQFLRFDCNKKNDPMNQTSSTSMRVLIHIVDKRVRCQSELECSHGIVCSYYEPHKGECHLTPFQHFFLAQKKCLEITNNVISIYETLTPREHTIPYERSNSLCHRTLLSTM